MISQNKDPRSIRDPSRNLSGELAWKPTCGCGDTYQIDLSNALVYDQLRVSKSGIRVKPCFAQCPACVQAEMHHVRVLTEPKLATGGEDAELRDIRDHFAQLEWKQSALAEGRWESFVENAKKVIKEAREEKMKQESAWAKSQAILSDTSERKCSVM